MARQLLPRVSPFDRLRQDDQYAVLAAYERVERAGRDRWMLRDRVSVRTVTRAARILLTLQPWDPDHPQPPPLADGIVWLYHQRGEWQKFSALAAKGSPVQRHLHGRTLGSRVTEAKRKVKNVETFRKQAPAWWWKTVRLQWAVFALTDADVKRFLGTN
ncbi:MAG: hypothetical protein DMF89_16405 [Acidobacteria bacterium]|nr:MAG: hypothetical protein DMF89_16405 [Acidobacteriota bacterium]